MHYVDLSEGARDYIEQLEHKFARQVAQKILQLAENPTPPQSIMLGGYEPFRRVRTGRYRIVYVVVGDTVRIILVDKRGDDTIYRTLARKYRK